ncbi:MAG: PorT family protein [Cytophagales bacterium]|nr:PorT family protein [Cytophagales bacterium]
MAKKSFFLLILVVLTHRLVFAQSFDPEQVLTQATDEFNAGRYYGIPALLKPVIDNSKTTNEQLVRAYLLLTQSYLILDDPIAAEDSYLKLLRADPEYVANTARDPIDVYYLSKKFTSTPIVTPHIRAGLNTSVVRIIRELTVSGTEIDTRSVLKAGVQVGLGFDFNLSTKWSIGIEGNFANKAFKRTTDKGNRKYFGADDLTTVERQNWFDVPVYVKYSYDSGKIRPFGYAGFAFNFLISARGINWQFRDNFADGSVKEAEEPNENLTYKRNLLNRSLVVGGGVKYKIGKDFLFVDVRYMPGLSNLTKADKIYYDKEGAFDPSVVFYGQVNDFFRLDNFSISGGYIRPIYNPRKKGKPLFGIFKKKPAPAVD